MPWRALATGWCLTLSIVGCGEVLGIEHAHYDPAVGDPSANKSDAGQTACALYCDTIMQNCRGVDLQYADVETCLAVCVQFPEGGALPGPENGLSCRQRQAEVSAIEPFVHCKYAGPAGNGECGTNCESLCSIIQGACTPATTSYYYADENACLEACAGVPDLVEFSANPAVELYEGGHVQCRIYHAVAATQDPGRHCEHALGGKPCEGEVDEDDADADVTD